MNRRTTLRPIDGPASKAPETLPPSGPVTRSSSMSPTTLLAGAAIAVGLGIIAALALLGSRSEPNQAFAARLPMAELPLVATPASQPAATPILAVPTRVCPSIASFLEVIATYELQAHWNLAATTAQTALRTPGLCTDERTALGRKLVALSREALFEQPAPPEDVPGQRRVVAAYADLKSLVNQYGLQPPPPLPIAQSAYDHRLFLLATVAYADALANGEVSAQDREVVRADYAAQYNLGLTWAQRSDAAQRQEGLARLATACRIDEQDRLGSRDACSALERLVGPRTRWPTPLNDPLIDTPVELTLVPGG